ncbi:hypothetical protein LIR33_21405 [Flavonifractor plautii]|uniref:TIM-barrel domain-containing protein n=1 Tax=Flavonifractor plautii TaxID=292800 RepID=UPI001D02ECBB|nr:TIM-barrel domain-containing protein [Flavonifractor plautii]MCB5780981.1 hypothetical protein [Flavonifractor plautii]
MKKIFRVCIALLLCFSLVTPAFALDGIWHNPYGIDDLYDHEPTEIYPLTPIAGEMIYIKSTTWPVEAGQSVWLTYTKNGEPQPDIGAEWKYNSGNNSYWEAAIGPFEKGDVIEYTVFADKDGQNTQSIGPFSFHVVEWERAQSVELGSQEDGLVVLNVTSDQGDSTPKLGLSFPSADVLRFQFSPLGDVAFEAGAADYSIEEDSNIGIDGFKTDGGEMVWGRNTSFYDGSDGLEMRNEYPNAYIEAYYDFTEENTGTGMTFSRAGTAGVQSTGVFWAGDQSSTFDALQDSISAGLSAGISGIPFWGWDLAGFTGDFPTAELYKRSTQAAAFAPIMQFHSEKANPSPSEERSPWNVQERTGDDTIIPTFRYYVNTRMNILPYIYSEAQQCTEDGTPLMRAMMIDFPEDPEAYDLEEQYMFGRSLLVAPVLEEGQTVKEIYLPEGEWIDFFHNALTAGGGTKNYYCDVDSIPVYVRNGSIIPMNLNEDYELGGSIGNDVDNYTNLTFRVYPKGDSSYTLVHSDRSTMTVSASEDFKNSSVSVSIPAAAIPVTTQVFGTEPTGVTVNGQAIQPAATLDEFQAAQTAYYYSSSEKLVYIKTAAGDASEIEIEGIYQAPYEAEHAEQANVAVNTDHEGYYGEGFVDQFASEGCAVTFTVYSDSDTALLDVRYSAGTEAAQRTLLVNGESILLDLPKTQDWDSWNTVSVPVELLPGQNTITISYQAGNFAGINLDCISLRNQ